MKVPGSLSQSTKRSLYESLNAEMIERIAPDVIPGYNLRARSGFPPNIPLPAQVAAGRFVDDAVSAGRYLHLVERLAGLDREGLMGRPYRISGLREIFKGIAADGILFDEETGRFMEDSRIRRTRDWGRLAEGDELRFTLLRIDVVKNSRLVKIHGETAARGAYEDLRAIFARCVERRGGRIWSWEGDGALAAFLFGHSTTASVLAGMALLHELFIYNRLHNRIGEPISIRSAIHTGPLRYHAEQGEIRKQETYHRVLEMEAASTAPNSLTISAAVAPTLDRVLLDRFKAPPSDSMRQLSYWVRLEEAG